MQTDYGLTEADVVALLSALTIIHKIGKVGDTWPECMTRAGVTEMQESEV